MRVVYISPGCFDKGGISRYNRYEIESLRQLYGEQNITVLTLLGPSDNDFEAPFSVDWYAGGSGFLQRVSFILKSIFTIIRLRPTIIQVAHINLSLIPFLVGRLVGSKLFINAYGQEVWSGVTRMSSISLWLADHIVADCHNTADFLVQKRNVSTSVSIIWDCVDHERFSPQNPDQSILKEYGIESSRNIVILGRVSFSAAHKGYERLLRAFSTMQISSDVRLVIAGTGDMVGYLSELSRDLDCFERTIFTGPIHESHLVDIYRSACVFVLVSDVGESRGEGIPLTPLEAMSCGIPIIVGNQDGSREAVEEGVNGFCIDPFDEPLLVATLGRLLEDLELHKQMAEGAYRISREKFSFLDFKKKHEAMYLEFAL
jgi:phosphatidyl-myo-inositol dimannoside synthase